MKNDSNERDRLYSYAEKDMDLSQIALLEHISIHYAKKKYKKHFGVSFTHLRVVSSSLAALASIDHEFQQSSAICIIEKKMLNISEEKSLYTRIKVVFRATFGMLVSNMKKKKGDITMREELIKLTRNDKIIIAQVLAKLQESSKERPITLTSISADFDYKKGKVRQMIVWLRGLGLPIASRPGRCNAGYYFADPGYENKEEQICLRWINAWRDSRWRKPALNVLFGM